MSETAPERRPLGLRLAGATAYSELIPGANGVHCFKASSRTRFSGFQRLEPVPGWHCVPLRRLPLTPGLDHVMGSGSAASPVRCSPTATALLLSTSYLHRTSAPARKALSALRLSAPARLKSRSLLPPASSPSIAVKAAGRIRRPSNVRTTPGQLRARISVWRRRPSHVADAHRAIRAVFCRKNWAPACPGRTSSAAIPC